MHEVLLHSQISPARHNQVLNILAGVTGSQPSAYQDQHLLFAQLRHVESNVSKKAQPTVQQQRWHHNLIRPVHASKDSAEAAGPWRLRVEQTPDPNIKDAIAREVTETELGDIEQFKDPTVFRPKANNYRLGHRFVSGNIIVRIFRILIATQIPPADKLLMGTPPTTAELEILDPSGTYMVEVSIRMEDRKNTKIAEQAHAELKAFKQNMEGCIDLRMPDRLSLDTRVKET